MKKLKVYQIDSFTKEKFTGNPAGVVVNADGLNAEQMQQIARELNNSETAFLCSPDGKDHDGIIRYFTPTTEVPTCGHATIAAMYALAVEENLESSILRMKTKIGVLPFEVIQKGSDYEVVMTQGNFELTDDLDKNTKSRIVTALDLNDDDLDTNCPIQIASTGHSKVMIGVKTNQILNRINPDMIELKSISKQIDCNGYFVFTFDSDHEDILTYGRMFAPILGIDEDPVTGNANGPLGGYLVKNNLVDFQGDVFEFNGCQGVKMKRSGIVKVKVNIQQNGTLKVQIKGDAVIIFTTEIEI